MTLGRKAVLLVATSAPAATPVSEAFDIEFDPTKVIADRTSNSSGAGVNRDTVRIDHALRFKTFADRADPGQAILIANSLDGENEKIAVDYREEGTGTGLPSVKFTGIAQGKRGAMKDGHVTIDWTVEIDGEPDHTAQS